MKIQERRLVQAGRGDWTASRIEEISDCKVSICSAVKPPLAIDSSMTGRDGTVESVGAVEGVTSGGFETATVGLKRLGDEQSYSYAGR